MRRFLCLLALFGLTACGPGGSGGDGKPVAQRDPPDPFSAARLAMVETQIVERGIQDERVLRAMRIVPRHEFVPQRARKLAYADTPLKIGLNQTISQPYIVAVMAELAALGPNARVLEIGTGSGYGAAVLAEVAKEVYTIEILAPLAKSADETLQRLGYTNVRCRQGDGYRGWKEAAPFDAIVVTAAPPHVPEPLKQQLKIGGRLVLPVGDKYQEMRVIERTKDGFLEQPLFPVRFVPMTGEALDPDGARTKRD